MLDAAREVFVAHGFSDASIADIVERAGSSVGSLYHHFGGKSELYVALWQEYTLAQEEAASQAVAANLPPALAVTTPLATSCLRVPWPTPRRWKPRTRTTW